MKLARFVKTVKQCGGQFTDWIQPSRSRPTNGGTKSWAGKISPRKLAGLFVHDFVTGACYLGHEILWRNRFRDVSRAAVGIDGVHAPGVKGVGFVVVGAI